MKYCLLIFFSCCSSLAHAQKGGFASDVAAFQKELNEEYRNPATTPLEPKALRKFRHHVFFPADSTYRVTARVVVLKNEKPFKMLTTQGTERDFIKYAELFFRLEEKEYKLTAYQGIELTKQEKYRDYLFVPFRDPTNGTTTYEGGRFMDLRIPKGEQLVIDFNKAYNPLCAYTKGKYACPIIPEENTLTVKIPAGIMLKPH